MICTGRQGGEKRHQPSDWMRLSQTKALIEAMEGPPGIPGGPTETVNDGRNNGTYVAKELVYAYAMWISPAFHLKVIRVWFAWIAGIPVIPGLCPVVAICDQSQNLCTRVKVW